MIDRNLYTDSSHNADDNQRPQLLIHLISSHPDTTMSLCSAHGIT